VRRRHLLAAASAVAALAVAGVPGAAARARTPTLPALFAKQIRAINAAPQAAPVLLPANMPLDAVREYPSGGPSGRGYDLEIGAVRRCDGADACFVASFTAEPGKTVFGAPVTVTGASRAGFHPLSCGASCSPPQIDFIVKGVRYTIQANLNHSAPPDKAALIAAAESAISAGARLV
jgi:hypothetical protein